MTECFGSRAGNPGSEMAWTDQMDGSHYMTVNGFAYQRLEFKFGQPKEVSDASQADFKANYPDW